MKNVLISSLAAAAFIASSAAYANDLVSEDAFFNNPSAQNAQVGVASTFDAAPAEKTSILDDEFVSTPR